VPCHIKTHNTTKIARVFFQREHRKPRHQVSDTELPSHLEVETQKPEQRIGFREYRSLMHTSFGAVFWQSDRQTLCLSVSTTPRGKMLLASYCSRKGGNKTQFSSSSSSSSSLNTSSIVANCQENNYFIMNSI